MGDVLGWRCRFGVMGPSTNTVVQPDFDAMRPAGVTNHYSRIFTPTPTPSPTRRSAPGAD
jgi:maleate isomerase